MKKCFIFCSFLFICLIASSAYAVDSNLFSQDDFIDPRVRGYTFLSESDEDYSRGDDLILTNLRVGAATDYQQREIFTEADAYFGQFDINYYRQAMQFGIKYSEFTSSLSDEISQDKLKLLFGFYMLREQTESKERDSVVRTILTWEHSDIPEGTIEEYSLDSDFEINNLLFGVSISKRSISKRQDENRILLRYYYPLESQPIEFRFSSGAAEIRNDWDYAISNLMVNYYVTIPKPFSEIHFYYSLAHRPGRGPRGSKTNNEFGVFINIPLKVFSGKSKW